MLPPHASDLLALLVAQHVATQGQKIVDAHLLFPDRRPDELVCAAIIDVVFWPEDDLVAETG